MSKLNNHAYGIGDVSVVTDERDVYYRIFVIVSIRNQSPVYEVGPILSSTTAPDRQHFYEDYIKQYCAKIEGGLTMLEKLVYGVPLSD